MEIEKFLLEKVTAAVTTLYGEVAPEAIQLQKTRKEFEGDMTLVVFPLLRASRKKPEQTAEEIGQALVAFRTRVSSRSKPPIWSPRRPKSPVIT